MNDHNHNSMRDLGKPIVQLNAKHEGNGASSATYDDAGNLHKSMPICIGARVMLRKTTWVERGLVNGAMGTVVGITWPTDTDNPRESVPLAILVRFDVYDTKTGPTL